MSDLSLLHIVVNLLYIYLGHCMAIVLVIMEILLLVNLVGNLELYTNHKPFISLGDVGKYLNLANSIGSPSKVYDILQKWKTPFVI